MPMAIAPVNEEVDMDDALRFRFSPLRNRIAHSVQLRYLISDRDALKLADEILDLKHEYLQKYSPVAGIDGSHREPITLKDLAYALYDKNIIDNTDPNYNKYMKKH